MAEDISIIEIGEWSYDHLLNIRVIDKSSKIECYFMKDASSFAKQDRQE